MTIINQLTSFKLSGITFGGTSQQLNYTAGVNAGSVIANKALVVDTNRDLVGADTTTRIRNLTLAGALNAVTLIGTIQTSNQPNITALGNLTNLTITNNLNLINHNGIDTGLLLNGNIVLTSAHQLNYNVVTPGTAAANKALVLDGSRIISNIHAINTTHVYTSDLYLDNELITATAGEINYLDIIAIGQGQASKALILDASRNISNINNLTVTTITATNVNITNLTGTVQTASQPNITSVGTLTSLNLSGAITGATSISTASLTLNGTLITSSAAELNKLTGVTTTPTQFNYLSGVNVGSASANKTLVVDTNRDITNINSISLNGINDVITLSNNTASARTNLKFINDIRSWEVGSKGSSASPANCFYIYDNNAASNRMIIYPTGNIDIVSHNNSTIGLMLGGTLITSSATELNILKGVTSNATQINYLSGSVPGTAIANKALILDSGLDIIGLNNIGTTSICLGTQTSNISQRFISAFDSTQALGSLEYISFGRSNTDRNSVDFGFLYNSSSSDTNAFTIGFPTVGRKFTLLANGFVGINTTGPDRQFEINAPSGNCLRLTYNDNDGSATNYTDLSVSSSGQLILMPSSNNANTIAGDILLKGSIIVGKDSTNNLIRFNGVTGDNDSNHTVIGERLYNGSDFSELLLFKGNDIIGASGPDRIRLRSGEIRFQTFTSTEDYSTLSDNNTRLIITNDGKIGINSTNPQRQLEINSATGDCLRLTYNDSIGTSTFYSDLSVSSNGTLRLKSINNIVVIGDITNTNQRLLIGADLLTATNGSLGLVTISGSSYIQPGINTTTGSAADLIISNYNQDITASSRKIIFKSDGKVGFNTISPQKQLEINSSTGDCLRLTYNNNSGSATNYGDITVSSTGNMTFTSNGTNTGFTFSGGNINGTINTASQPNITSLGTLTSLTLSGAISGVTNITLSGTLSGATSLSATNLSGLLTTANQSNITDLGVLNGLKITNNLKIGTTGVNAEDMIHLENSSNSFIGIQIENRNTTAETSGCKLSFMGFRDVNNAYEVTRIASVTTTSDAPTVYQYGALAFYTRNNYLDSNLTERMRIINNGNIGINTTNPTEKLHIVGNILTTGTISNSSTITSSNNITGLNIYASTGRVFISSCDLGMSHRSSTGSTKSELLTISDGTNTGIGSFNSFPFTLFTNNTEYMRIATNGNVGIRTTNPLGYLDFGQNASDNVINLFTNSSTTETYKLGANNTLLKYQAGTTGGHAWYNNSTTISSGTERMRLDSNGNLGIAKTNPSYKLDVNGIIRGSQVLVGDSTDTARLVSILDSTMTANTTRFITLGKSNSANNQAEIYYKWVSDASSSNSLSFGFYGSTTMTLLASGNVGIGTISPTSTLEISGTTKSTTIQCNNIITNSANPYVQLADNTIVSSVSSCFTRLFSYAGDNTFYIQSGTANTSGSAADIFFGNVGIDRGTSTRKIIFKDNGNVGLGTITPACKLDVQDGTIRVLNTTSPGVPTSGMGMEFSMSSSRANIYSYNRSGNEYKDLNINDKMIITGADGRVGIGLTSPSYLLHLNSDSAAKPNNSLWTVTSDIRIKEDIVDADLNLCYDNVKQIKLRYYKWKDQFIKNHSINDAHRIGWIAQEVEKVMPKAITTNNNELYNIKDFKSLNADQLYASMYGCVQKLIIDKEEIETELLEQKNINDKLNNKIEDMEELILEMHDKIEDLTKLVNSLINN